MVIPDEVAWGSLLTFGLALSGWLIRQDRRISARLTREEHEKICNSKHAEVTATLTRIERSITDEAREAGAYRRQTTKDIHRIDKRVAVMKATLGQPNDDDGEDS